MFCKMVKLKRYLKYIVLTGLLIAIVKIFLIQSSVKIRWKHQRITNTHGKSLESSSFSASPNQADGELSRHKIWDSLQCATIDKTQMKPKLKPRTAQSKVPLELYHMNWTNSFLDAHKVIKWPKWDICNVGEEENLLLLFVISHKAGKHMRDAVRTTFGYIKKFSSWKIRTVFLYGDANNSVLPNEMDEDVLVGNFPDGYKQMTEKDTFGFKWIQLYCPRAKYVFRITHDVFMNLTKVVNFLDDILEKNVTRLYHGHTLTNSKIRRNFGKTKLVCPVKGWEAHYPRYVTGCGILFSQSVIRDMNFLLCKLPLCFPDDTYFGSLMEMLGVPVTGNNKYALRFYDRHEARLGQDPKNAASVIPETAILSHYYNVSNPTNIQKLLWEAYLDKSLQHNYEIQYHIRKRN
ncbi:unnamed protein product [Owenia fusiformis]|uniref:Hexosyltransferase n=1 Tax=Owenia fusiformis TaxID=6347 RepID=A0A8S4PUH8_OWEFU|nr:unnamed protein product [Owenia fusiformis]